MRVYFGVRHEVHNLPPRPLNEFSTEQLNFALANGFHRSAEFNGVSAEEMQEQTRIILLAREKGWPV